MTPKGIPTIYKGYQFRSRLEAKWAVFFDLCEWNWEYEPVDFKGWIPDFALYGKDVVYVEVKPVVEFPKEVAEKIDKSMCDKEVLIVGQSNPIPCSSTHHEISLGWIREIYPDGSFWDEAAYGRWEEGKGKIGFCHAQGSFQDRISGGYDGGRYGNVSLKRDEVEDLWSKACNLVQWKKP